jgi:hypothetical protein
MDEMELDDTLPLAASMQPSAAPSITVSTTRESSATASTAVSNSPTTSTPHSVPPNAANATTLPSYVVTINATLKKTKSATEGSLAPAQINYHSSQSLKEALWTHFSPSISIWAIKDENGKYVTDPRTPTVADIDAFFTIKASNHSYKFSLRKCQRCQSTTIRDITNQFNKPSFGSWSPQCQQGRQCAAHHGPSGEELGVKINHFVNLQTLP